VFPSDSTSAAKVSLNQHDDSVLKRLSIFIEDYCKSCESLKIHHNVHMCTTTPSRGLHRCSICEGKLIAVLIVREAIEGT
jgi:hypothetical protein